MTNITTLRDAMRLIAATSAVLLATGAGSAFAAIDVTSENFQTGYNSNNQGTFDIDDNVDVNVDYNADANNDINVDFETGHNKLYNNTTAEDVETGEVEVVGDITNDLNQGVGVSGLAGLDWGDISADFSNDTTGSNSDNRNKLNVDRDLNVDANYDANIDNDIDIDANTGHNRTYNNTTVGDVTTGPVNVDLTIENHANTGNAGVDLSGIGGGDVSADFSNDTTGANSDNRNTLDVDQDVDVDVNYNADIKNDIEVDADTGHNDTYNNTTVGNVKTGAVNATFNIVNQAN